MSNTPANLFSLLPNSKPIKFQGFFQGDYDTKTNSLNIFKELDKVMLKDLLFLFKRLNKIKLKIV